MHDKAMRRSVWEAAWNYFFLFHLNLIVSLGSLLFPLRQAWKKREKSQVPNRMQIYDILNTGRVLYQLSYGETYRVRENCLVIGENNGKF